MYVYRYNFFLGREKVSYHNSKPLDLLFPAPICVNRNSLDTLCKR